MPAGPPAPVPAPVAATPLLSVLSTSAGAVGLAEPVWFSTIINGMPSATAVSAEGRIAAAIAAYPSPVALGALERVP